MVLGRPIGGPDALLGQRLPDGTRLEAWIGGGAFAHVYRAIWVTGAPVAVKVLVDTSAAARKRFERELRVMELLADNHAVVRLLGRGELADGRPYGIMELVRGYTLRALLDSGYVLEPDAAVALMLQLCAAFSDLHRLGVAHGDLCPSNVLIDADGGRARLCDFGLARDAQGLLRLMEEERMLAGRTFAEELDEGMLMGTPAYMAPEQIEDALNPSDRPRTDTPSDVYALGVVLYEMLAGRNPHPFEPRASRGRRWQQEALEYCRLRLEARDAPVAGLSVPSALWSIIEVCLSSDPRVRYGDARELRAALEHYSVAMSDGSQAAFVAMNTVRRMAAMTGEHYEAPLDDPTIREDPEIAPSPVAGAPGPRWWWYLGAGAVLAAAIVAALALR